MKRTPITVDFDLFPDDFHSLLAEGAVYDSSCSAEARVHEIDAGSGFFLKSAPRGTLKAEADMTRYFHSRGLGPEVLCYLSADLDWLLTRRIPGEDCTHPQYLDDPKRLSEATALLLRSLHETPLVGVPMRNRLEVYRKNCLHSTKFEPELFAGVWDFPSPEEARAVIRANFPYLKPDTLIHGDYCLPNILLDNWRFSGFIDLGGAGVGDKHMDILWGCWTLNFNLHTNEYFDRFLDAYGREAVEPELLRTMAAMEILT